MGGGGVLEDCQGGDASLVIIDCLFVFVTRVSCVVSSLALQFTIDVGN